MFVKNHKLLIPPPLFEN